MAENCWVLATPDGIHLDNGDFVEHFTTATDAAKRAADDIGEYSPGHFADGTPLQLDQPCLTVNCGCCGEDYDEAGAGHTVHFEPGEQSLVTEDEWTAQPDGSYRCPDCGPDGDCDVCEAQREAVASNA